MLSFIGCALTKLKQSGWLFGILLLTAISSGCGNDEKEKEQEETTILSELPPIEVSVEEIGEEDFYLELVSNGKLEGVSKADMRFRLAERIKKIYVKNGQTVKKGQLLAELDDFEQRNKFRQSEVSLENARISLADYLINQGYSLSDSASISDEIMEIAKVKSGFSAARHNLELAVYTLSLCKMTASTNGEIANLSAKELSYPKSGEPFCLIIDRSKMEIRFPIMEPEASLVQKDQPITISPYYQTEELSGKIVAVNPVINENGLIEVTAMISNPNKTLIEGMNTKVFIRKNIGKRIAVPKEALTLRSERPVVFICKDGKALWNYVKVGEENSSHVVVTSENTPFKTGDQVIVDGNLHLAHESRVIVKP